MTAAPPVFETMLLPGKAESRSWVPAVPVNAPGAGLCAKAATGKTVATANTGKQRKRTIRHPQNGNALEPETTNLIPL
jgi:hypothetical protein